MVRFVASGKGCKLKACVFENLGGCLLLCLLQGTPACEKSEGFYCANRGYTPTTVHSATVDDGVCDCCDGSDEGHGFCIDACSTLRNQRHAALIAEVRTLQPSPLVPNLTEMNVTA